MEKSCGNCIFSTWAPADGLTCDCTGEQMPDNKSCDGWEFDSRGASGECISCLDCVYIGDGDYTCMKETPSRIVITDFETATDDYVWCKKEGAAMQIIKVKFIRHEKPAGKSYSYYSPVEVAVGDKVQINESAVGVVVEVDVPEAEVAAYLDRLKTIVGLVEEPKMEYDPPEVFDPQEAAEAQARYCREHNVPRFAPRSGRCWNCDQNIYLPGKHVVPGESKFRTGLDSVGISVERAGREHITGCPHCNWSFCE